MDERNWSSGLVKSGLGKIITSNLLPRSVLAPSSLSSLGAGVVFLNACGHIKHSSNAWGHSWAAVEGGTKISSGCFLIHLFCLITRVSPPQSSSPSCPSFFIIPTSEAVSPLCLPPRLPDTEEVRKSCWVNESTTSGWMNASPFI